MVIAKLGIHIRSVETLKVKSFTWYLPTTEYVKPSVDEPTRGNPAQLGVVKVFGDS